MLGDKLFTISIKESIGSVYRKLLSIEFLWWARL